MTYSEARDFSVVSFGKVYRSAPNRVPVLNAAGDQLGRILMFSVHSICQSSVAQA